MAGLLVAPSAFAADLAPVPYPQSQKLQWSGFYLGANAGFAWSFDPRTDCIGVVAPCTTTSFPAAAPAGAAFGVQAGYNWQVGDFVLGLEGDANKLFAQGVTHFPGVDPGKGPDQLSSRYDWLGTARARVGVARNAALFYATGGFAYGRVGHEYIYAPGSPTDTQSFNLSENRMGWAVGGGVEYSLSQNWSVRAEYLYVHLAASNLDISSLQFNGGGGNPPGTSVLHINNNLNIVRLGANYRF